MTNNILLLLSKSKRRIESHGNLKEMNTGQTHATGYKFHHFSTNPEKVSLTEVFFFFLLLHADSSQILSSGYMSK